MDYIPFSDQDYSLFSGVLADAVRHIPALAVCYLICYSIAAVVHEFWPRYTLLAYFGLALAVALVGGHG